METHGFDPSQFSGLEKEAIVSVHLASAEDSRALGAWMSDWLEEGDVVGLIGNLGAGKTTLTQGLVQALVDDQASSPTYTLLNVYEGDTEVFHFDLYRLEDIHDLETVGYWDYVESGFGISVIEWLDRIPGAWTGEGIVLFLEREGDGRRCEIWSTSRPAARIRKSEPWTNT